MLKNNEIINKYTSKFASLCNFHLISNTQSIPRYVWDQVWTVFPLLLMEGFITLLKNFRVCVEDFSATWWNNIGLISSKWPLIRFVVTVCGERHSDTTRTLEYVQTIYKTIVIRIRLEHVIRIVDHLAMFTYIDYFPHPRDTPPFRAIETRFAESSLSLLPSS